MQIFCRLFIFATFLWGLFSPQILRAQGQDLITHSDCQSTFPNCTVYLSARATELGGEPVLSVDGIAVQPLTTQTEAVGVVVAFALDEFVPGVLAPGLSGQPRYIEFRQTAIDFFELAETQGALNKFWLAAYRTGMPDEGSGVIRDFPAIVDWVADPLLNAFFNEMSVYETDPTKNTPETPLYDLTRTIIDAIDRSGAPNYFARHLIVYTDGFERIETLGLDEIIRLAQEKNIYIHTVMLGRGSADFETVLRKIAEPTGGQFVRYESPADMEPLWSRLMLDVNQTAITFPLPTVNAREIQLAVNGVTTRAPLSLPVLQKPTIELISPQAGTIIQRVAASENSPLTEADPQTIQVQLEIALPDNQGTVAERIAFVEYIIGDITRRQEVAPLDQFMLPIDTLDSGEYTLRVRIEDKFTGLTESAPLPVRIEVLRPTPVPPTATATVSTTNIITDGNTVNGISSAADRSTGTGSAASDIGASFENLRLQAQQIWQRAGIYGWIALAALFLLLLLVLFRTRRNKPQPGSFAFTSDPPNYGDHTEPDDATEPATEAFPVANLVLVRGEGSLPQSLPLYRQQFEFARENIWSIGRSYQENDTVIDSKRISKVHATITEQNGQFRIRDEMSSGGTYITSGATRVRQRLEAMEPTPLHDNDVINFNSIAYRFEVDKGESLSADTEPDLGVETTNSLDDD